MDNARRRFSIREPSAPVQLEMTVQNVDALLDAATVAQFAQFSAHLNQQQTQNKADLKHAVTKSVDQVVAVSSALQGSRQSLAQLKPNIDALCDLLHLQLEMAQLNVNKDVGGANRKSMMFLQSNWSASIKDLYLRIDGLIDLLPYANRRIDCETKKWWEFNQTSGKAIRPLHVVVLSDSLVIAVRSKVEKKSRATHCWPIESLNVQYLEDSTAIHLSQPSSSTPTFVMKTNSVEEFSTLANSLKSTISQAKKLTKHKRRISSQIESPSTAKHRISTNLDAPPMELIKSIEKNVDVIDELLTSLSLSMSLKNYDSSVGFIKSLEQQLEHLLTSYPQSVSQHISIIYDIKVSSFNTLKDQVVSKLIQELSLNVECGSPKSKPLVELLSILGKPYLLQAQDYWLEKREKDLAHSVSTLRFGSNPTSIKKSPTSVLGHHKRESIMISQQTPQPTQAPVMDADVGPIGATEDSDNEAMAGYIILSYVRELSLIHVGVCIRAWNEYNLAFQSAPSTKVFDWIVSKMESLKFQLENVLVDYDHNSEAWAKSTEILKSITTKLTDKGLDVSFVFADF